MEAVEAVGERSGLENVHVTSDIKFLKDWRCGQSVGVSDSRNSALKMDLSRMTSIARTDDNVKERIEAVGQVDVCTGVELKSAKRSISSTSADGHQSRGQAAAYAEAILCAQPWRDFAIVLLTNTVKATVVRADRTEDGEVRMLGLRSIQ